MKVIRYQTLRNPPSWRTNTPLAEFDFFVDKLIIALEKKIKSFVDYPVLLRSAPNRKTCKYLQVLVRRAKAVLASEAQVTIWPVSKRDLMWWIVGQLVVDGDFASVRCLACDIDYLSEQCALENWSIGEGLAMEGGKRLFCPCGHMLFTRMEWNS